MTHFLELGALNKLTNLYEFPYQAQKKNEYSCVSCKSDVIFCVFKNANYQNYFRHKSLTSCKVYENKPCESDLHISAKYLLKSLFDKKSKIKISRKCQYCSSKIPVFKMGVSDYTDNTVCKIEYSFPHNGSTKRADVALIVDGTLNIFEIINTHKTDEQNRPDIWFEIKADELLKNYCLKDENIIITCEREYFCPPCVEEQKKREELRQKQIEEQNKIIAEKLKRQELERIEEQRIKEKRIEEERIRKQQELELKARIEQKELELKALQEKQELELKERREKQALELKARKEKQALEQKYLLVLQELKKVLFERKKKTARKIIKTRGDKKTIPVSQFKILKSATKTHCASFNDIVNQQWNNKLKYKGFRKN